MSGTEKELFPLSGAYIECHVGSFLQAGWRICIEEDKGSMSNKLPSWRKSIGMLPGTCICDPFVRIKGSFCGHLHEQSSFFDGFIFGNLK